MKRSAQRLFWRLAGLVLSLALAAPVLAQNLAGEWSIAVSNGDYGSITFNGSGPSYTADLYFTDYAHSLSAYETCIVGPDGRGGFNIICEVVQAPAAWQADNFTITSPDPQFMTGTAIGNGVNQATFARVSPPPTPEPAPAPPVATPQPEPEPRREPEPERVAPTVPPMPPPSCPTLKGNNQSLALAHNAVVDWYGLKFRLDGWGDGEAGKQFDGEVSIRSNLPSMNGTFAAPDGTFVVRDSGLCPGSEYTFTCKVAGGQLACKVSVF